MPVTPFTGNTVWIDGSGGSDSADGYASSRPVKTAAKALAQLALLISDSGKALFYKNMRETITWTISNLSMYIWGDNTIPTSRGDTQITTPFLQEDVTNAWSSSTLGYTIGCVVVDWDNTLNAWGAHPAHLLQVASLAACKAADNSFFQSGGTLYVNLAGDDPNAHVVSVTEHASTGPERNGIDLTGNNNYVECYTALWTEGGGTGTGSNGLGGWGVILRGDTGNHIVLYGAKDFGYKAAAIIGTGCVVEGANGCVLAGYSNHTAQGITSNGNAGVTGQSGPSENATAMNVKNMVIHMHSLLRRGTGTPLNQTSTGTFAGVLCHAQGGFKISGLVISEITFFNDFDQDANPTYAGDLNTTVSSAKTLGIGHPATVRHCVFLFIRKILTQENMWYDRNLVFATKGVNFVGVFESNSGSTGQILTLTGNLVVYNGNSGGSGYGYGCLFGLTTASMEVYSIGNTYINTYSTNSNQALVIPNAASTKFYSRQDIVYMPNNSIAITNKRLFADPGTLGYPTLDLDYMYVIGVGQWKDGTSFTLPASFDSTHANSGTSQAVTDALSTTIFTTPSTNDAQTNLNTNYHLKSSAPAAILALNVLSVHMYFGPDSRPYTGTFGAYQQLATTLSLLKKSLLLDLD